MATGQHGGAACWVWGRLDRSLRACTNFLSLLLLLLLLLLCGLQKYENNLKKGSLTDNTIMLWNDRCAQLPAALYCLPSKLQVALSRSAGRKIDATTAKDWTPFFCHSVRCCADIADVQHTDINLHGV